MPGVPPPCQSPGEHHASPYQLSFCHHPVQQRLNSLPQALGDESGARGAVCVVGDGVASSLPGPLPQQEKKVLDLRRRFHFRNSWMGHGPASDYNLSLKSRWKRY